MSRQQSLSDALKDHSLEGITILVSEPLRLIRLTNYVIAALLISAVLWAFVAKADVLVSAVGSVVPEDDIRRVYVPIEGELVDIYVTAGMPVQAGDILARINARGAINAASKVVEANIRLADAKLEFDNFPAKRALMQRKIDSLQSQLEFLQEDYNKQMADGMAKLASAQRAKLMEARNAVDQALRAERNAKQEAEQFTRLLNMEGGGGVSRAQVEQKRNAYLDAQAQTSNAQARLSSLEYDLSTAVSQADKQVASTAQELADTRIQLESTLRDIEREQAEVEVRYRSAKLAADSAARVSFENFDENNFLKILAPVSGVVTYVPLSQEGDKIQSSQPLLSIAPSDSRKILRVRIAEKDRGFLQIGQTAKLKFNAFPYQNYGSIEGALEYISPTVVKSGANDNSPPSYEGEISLSTDQIQTAAGGATIRYGMGAVAEIVVRERRVIDFALDPLRGLK